jgi:acyl-CoA thioesterase FadM
MLRYVLQALWCMFRSWRQPSVGVLDEVRTLFRVWPGDLDTNRHMNNGRYLTIMDFGRFDLLVRSGLWSHVWRNRWAPVLASATIRWRRELKPFARYEVVTRIVGWDERWFFIEQKFVVSGTVAAQAVVRGTFLQRRKSVPPGDIFEKLGASHDSPPLPEHVRLWLASEEAARQAA